MVQLRTLQCINSNYCFGVKKPVTYYFNLHLSGSFSLYIFFIYSTSLSLHQLNLCNSPETAFLPETALSVSTQIWNHDWSFSYHVCDLALAKQESDLGSVLKRFPCATRQSVLTYLSNIKYILFFFSVSTLCYAAKKKKKSMYYGWERVMQHGRVIPRYGTESHTIIVYILYTVNKYAFLCMIQTLH